MIRNPYPFVTVILVLALAALGCNFTGGGPAVDAPVVEIRVPASETTYAVGTTVIVEVYATDAGSGIGRVELELDGLPYATVEAEDPAGQAVLLATFAWMAESVGTHTLGARAIRADDSAASIESDLTQLLINVVEAERPALDDPGAAPGSATPPGEGSQDGIQLTTAPGLDADATAPGESTPEETKPTGTPAQDAPTTAPTQAPPTQAPPTQAAATGTPAPPTFTPTTASSRITGTTLSNLNIRTGPGTNYPAIGSYLLGQEVELVGRNQLSTWLVVPRAGGQQGWIFAQLVDVAGSLQDLPVVAAPPPPPPTATPTFTFTPPPTAVPATNTPAALPDLFIEGAQFSPGLPPTEGVTINVSVTVRNQGNADSEGFLVRLEFLYGDQVESAPLAFPPIAAGQTATNSGFITLPAGSATQSGNANLRVDAENAVAESDENNNLFASAGYVIQAAGPTPTPTATESP